ncbi:MAG: preprotein translocase subunit YajC [Alphaproteobacteria bacterium]
MLIKSAFAEEGLQTTTVQNAQTSLPNTGLMSFLPFIMIFVVFYFMLIRPQMKKQKEHQNLLGSLKKGEKVVTNGGIIGTIHKIEDDNSTVQIEIAPEIKIKVLKANIVEVLSRTQDKEEVK